jgi:predicted glycosyltransferase
MRILIDIGHPAHVHLFKHFAWDMQSRGHNLFFTCRDKEFEIFLLEKYDFQYKSFGKKYSSTIGKLWGMVEFGLKELFAGIKFKPDILLSHGSMYAAHAAFLLGKPHISLEDTFNFEQIRFYKPFTKHILTANYEHPLSGAKVIKYAGYHELAYLHPNRFSPDKTVLNELGVKEGERFVIIRFVSWNASHDIGHKGINYENKIKTIEEFGKYAKVFISSESKLPPELEQFRIRIAPYRMHNAMAFASLVFGESATMVSEAVIMGTPGIYLDNTGRFYTNEQEVKYGMCFNYSESLEDQQKAIEKGIEILKTEGLKEEWLAKRDKMLEDKIDVTAFLVWFIENYPTSAKVMKENPDYQYNFK